MPAQPQNNKALTDEELLGFTESAKDADEIDAAWRRGYAAGERHIKRTRNGLTNEMLTYFIGGMVLYTIVLLVSAGWHDGKA